MMIREVFLTVLVGALLALACGTNSEDRRGRAPVVSPTHIAPSPTQAPIATTTPEPIPTPEREPTPTPEPPPTATPRPAVRGQAFALGDGVAVRSEPTTETGSIVRRLRHLEEVTILDFVYGEQWIVGDQAWPMVPHYWTRDWYQLQDGYVYSAWVFVPNPDERSPLIRSAIERRLSVSLVTQRLTAYLGDEPVYTARVTTGKPGYETPPGSYRLWPDGRRINETMTSARAAIADPDEEYDVKNVLYTQYFDALGDALHMNFWQPEWVFGWQSTSHGCIGLLLHDAQWLWLFVQSGTTLVVSA